MTKSQLRKIDPDRPLEEKLISVRDDEHLRPIFRQIASRKIGHYSQRLEKLVYWYLGTCAGKRVLAKKMSVMTGSIHSQRDFFDKVFIPYFALTMIRGMDVHEEGFKESGLERHLQDNKGAIIISNHRKILDPILLGYVLGQRREEYWHRLHPIIGDNLTVASEGLVSLFELSNAEIYQREDITRSDAGFTAGYGKLGMIKRVNTLTDAGNSVWVARRKGRENGIEEADPDVVTPFLRQNIPVFTASIAYEVDAGIPHVVARRAQGNEFQPDRDEYLRVMMDELTSYSGQTVVRWGPQINLDDVSKEDIGVKGTRRVSEQITGNIPVLSTSIFAAEMLKAIDTQGGPTATSRAEKELLNQLKGKSPEVYRGILESYAASALRLQ